MVLFNTNNEAFCAEPAPTDPPVVVTPPGSTPPAIKLVPSTRTARDGRLPFKVQCDKLVSARLDPLINPCAVSGHMHDVSGSDRFGACLIEPQDYSPPAKTTCNVPTDLSMYWFPSLYVKNPRTGALDLVRSFTQAYYLSSANKDLNAGKEMHAFPLGLKMILGTPKRDKNSEGARAGPFPGQSNLAAFRDQPTWFCHDAPGGKPRFVNSGFGGFPGLTSTNGLPCTFWQARMSFPDCWDGCATLSFYHMRCM